ncbi:MAG TPA: nucleotidyltransferase domain-containing protein [Solirubrobacteraceae bacterium]|nr:nucleotidyltransferase domain-containing protein [Solirubrobacteraceae bacterium]
MSDVVQRMVDLVVRCCDPDEVHVFGSYAKGLQRVDSDVDLLIVTDARSPQALVWEVRDLLARFPIDVDVHVIAPATVPEAWADRGSFRQSILSSARRVYARPANRRRHP